MSRFLYIFVTQTGEPVHQGVSFPPPRAPIIVYETMSKSVENLTEKFKNYLETHKLRKTPERFALMEKAMTLPGHFDVDELYEVMDSEGFHVSKATIYSTLELLVDCGMLNRHLFGSRKTSYEAAKMNHFHLVCSTCGKIREIEDSEMMGIPDSIDLLGFRPTYFSTMIYGTCRECLEKKRNDN